MYCQPNFKTKKALKEAVAAWNEYSANPELWTLNNAAPSTLGAGRRPPRPVTYFQPGPFGGNEKSNGNFCVEGPHFPEPHRWYASCVAKDGVIIQVK